MFEVIYSKNLGTKELRTKRLILRKFTINDAKDMYNNYGSDSKVSKYLAWNTHQSIKDSVLYIKGILKQYRSDSTY